MNSEIDLHGFTRVEAIEKLISFYNSRVKAGNKESFCIIHGYGSSGVGGVLLKCIRGFLNRHGNFLEFELGENTLSRNFGKTIVYPHKLLPETVDLLAYEILDYCSTPKTMSKISGKFRRYGDIKIHEAVKNLEKNGSLTSFIKGHYREWKTETKTNNS